MSSAKEPPLFQYSAQHRALLIRGDLLDVDPNSYVAIPTDKLRLDGWLGLDGGMPDISPRPSIALGGNVEQAARQAAAMKVAAQLVKGGGRRGR